MDTATSRRGVESELRWEGWAKQVSHVSRRRSNAALLVYFMRCVPLWTRTRHECREKVVGSVE